MINQNNEIKDWESILTKDEILEISLMLNADKITAVDYVVSEPYTPTEHQMIIGDLKVIEKTSKGWMMTLISEENFTNDKIKPSVSICKRHTINDKKGLKSFTTEFKYSHIDEHSTAPLVKYLICTKEDAPILKGLLEYSISISKFGFIKTLTYTVHGSLDHDEYYELLAFMNKQGFEYVETFSKEGETSYRYKSKEYDSKDVHGVPNKIIKIANKMLKRNFI